MLRLRSTASTALGYPLVRLLLLLSVAAVLALFLAHETVEERLSAAAITCAALALVALRAPGRRQRPPSLTCPDRARRAVPGPAHADPFVRRPLVPLRL